MIRNAFAFLAAFVASALIALVVRATMFQPHDGHEGHPAAGGDYAPMVSNPLTPAVPPEEVPAKPHAGHDAPTPTTAGPGQPVNTICAICGMDVDPNLPTMQFQGQTIGFGCRMCLPKVKADPERYGPAYLRNEVIGR